MVLSRPEDTYHSFAQLAMALKEVPRTGWLDRGVDPLSAESVADHSWSVALLAWVLAAEDPSLDRDRVLKLALIHDLAEAITGDLTPYGATAGHPSDTSFFNRRHMHTTESARAKRDAEVQAIDQFAELLPDAVANELRTLWVEYAERETPEARFVKEVDRLETYIQSLRYLRQSPSLPMDSFRLEVEAEMTHPALIRIRDAALA